MPGPYTVDASVFLNAFIPSEAGHMKSKEFLSWLKSEAIPIIAPTILLPEVAAAIRRGGDDAQLARRFARTLSRLPNLMLVTLDKRLALQTADVAANSGLRGSDAVYAAVATRFACPLVTLDREQHDRVANVLKAHYPGDLL
jgi:predicted nucleic acid-binding protein